MIILFFFATYSPASTDARRRACVTEAREPRGASLNERGSRQLLGPSEEILEVFFLYNTITYLNYLIAQLL